MKAMKLTGVGGSGPPFSNIGDLAAEMPAACIFSARPREEMLSPDVLG